jgi:eukaryotic-like serine/threonine-protein kinase
MSQPDEPPSTTVGDTMSWGVDVPERDLTGVTLGDFQVERLLGRGGMGEVYLARQLSLNRPVALKVLRPDLLTKATYLGRFEAEATAVAKLNHPNIVHIYTLGETDGVRFIAMEYVLGTNLREYLRKKGALEYPLALSIMKQAGVAVGAAGELGLIHRDIKPENLLLTKKGQVKVADFGLCRDLDSNRVSLTQTGITMGTPLYMSPEQAQGHAQDHRSDLYSLGVTFYHMIAGVPPFKADTAIALALKHVKDTPASLSVHRPDVAPELDRLVLKLMAKAPADRYQSAAEMLRDLAKVREAMHAPSGVQPSVPDLPGPSYTLPATLADGLPALDRTSPPAASSSIALRTLFLSPDTSRPLIGTTLGVVLVTLGLVLGAAVGWINRPEDLLAPGASAGTKVMPGLWISPRWKDVEKGLSAEDQYHYAQIRAPKDSLEVAWLAVPGHFPASREWASRAYT